MPLTRAIIQARVGSSRLPGKVLRILGTRTVLAHVIARAGACRRIDEVVVATTTASRDDAVAAEAARCGAGVWRGDEDDVLDRFHGAAAGADVIVRITSDCPLLDPAVVDAMIARFVALRADGAPVEYLSNGLVRTFPRGLDAEVFTTDALDRAWREAREPHEREHVTPYLYAPANAERVASFEGARDLSALRWTLDTEDDWAFLSGLFLAAPELESKTDHGAVLAVLARHPSLTTLNAHVAQKPVPTAASAPDPTASHRA